MQQVMEISSKHELLNLVVSLLGISAARLRIAEEVGVLLVRRLGELRVRPEIRGQVGVGLRDGLEGSLDEVTASLRLSARLGVGIEVTSSDEELLRGLGRNETSTLRGRDDAEGDGTALSGDLARHGVRSAEARTPPASADRDKRELGIDESTADSVGNLTADLLSDTDVSLLLSNKRKRTWKQNE
jgi:hypothetical protein